MKPKEPTDYYKKQITLQDLLPGDILIFEGDKGDFASRTIMKLTNSKVSHSALYFQNDPVKALADAGEKGLRVHEVSNKQNLRQIYVSRLKDPETGKCFPNSDLDPVLRAAKKYIDQDLDYPFGDLLVLALIVLFSKSSLSIFNVYKVTKALIALFKVLVDDIVYRGKHPMVCSSFVYQCYQDAANGNGDPKKANKKFKLNIENGDIKSVKRGALMQENDTQTLIDLYAQYVEEKQLHSVTLAELEKDEDEEELNKEQIEALFEDSLLENEKEMVTLNVFEDAKDLVLKVLKYVAKLLKVPAEKIGELIKELQDMQSLFVTPNDLCYNVTNTEKIGYLNIERKSEPLDKNKITTKYNT